MAEQNLDHAVTITVTPHPDVMSAVDVDDAAGLAAVLSTGDCSNACVHEALMKCASRGLTACVEALLEHGADCNHLDSFTNTPLILASEGGHVDIVDLLLRAGCDVNSVDIETRTALHWSALNGHLAIVQRLLAHGATSCQDKIYGFTPLMLAARQGHALMIELLLRHTSDIDATDIHRETALFDAVRNNNVDCVRMLIENGADIDHRENENRTPLLVAVMWNRPAMVLALVNANCQLDVAAVLSYFMRYRAANEMSRTPLEAAILKGYFSIAQILVLAGSDANALHNFSRSDIMLRVTTGETTIAEQECRVWLDDVCQPRSMKEACRIAVRRSIGPFYKKNLSTLGVGAVLQEYLLIPELDAFRLTSN